MLKFFSALKLLGSAFIPGQWLDGGVVLAIDEHGSSSIIENKNKNQNNNYNKRMNDSWALNEYD